MGTTILGKVGLTPRGGWNAATANYEFLDTVTYQGSACMVIIPTGNVPAGTPPTNSTYWQVIAERGAQGTKGWAPVLVNIIDGSRVVQKLVGYVGGDGSAPTENVGSYVGPTGYTAVIANATDVKGVAGTNGDVTAVANRWTVRGAGYAINELATYVIDGNEYQFRSIVPNNTAIPNIDGVGSWTKTNDQYAPQVYDPTITYALGVICWVSISGVSIAFKSKSATNLNHEPATDVNQVYWQKLGRYWGFYQAGTYGLNDVVILSTDSNRIYISNKIGNTASLDDIGGTGSWLLLGMNPSSVAAIDDTITYLKTAAIPESANLISTITDNTAYTSSSSDPVSNNGTCATDKIPVPTPTVIIRLRGFTLANMPNTVARCFNSAGTAILTVLKTDLVSEGDHYIYTLTSPTTVTMGWNMPIANKSTFKIYLTNAVPAVKGYKVVPKSELLTAVVVPANLFTTIYTFYYATSAANNTVKTNSGSIHSSNQIPAVANQVFSFQGMGTTLSNPLTTIGKFVRADGTFRLNIVAADFIAIANGYRLTIPSTYTDVVGIILNVRAADEANIIVQQSYTVVNPEGWGPIQNKWLPAVTPPKTDTSPLSFFDRGAAVKPLTTDKAMLIEIDGQSNAWGRELGTNVPQWFIDMGRKIIGVNHSANTNESITNLNATFKPYEILTTDKWGFELWMYKYLLDYLRTKTGNPDYAIYVVKHAVGATPMNPLASNNADAFWTPDFATIPVAKGALLKGKEARYNLIKNSAVGALVYYSCLIINQGEGDSTRPDEYYQILKDHIGYQRGIKKDPRFKVVLCGINSSSGQYSQIVEGSKLALSLELNDCYYVPADNGLQYLMADGLHYNAVGNESMGNKIFNLIKDWNTPQIDLKGEKLS